MRGQRAEGVEMRGQKVAGWAEEISDVPGGAGVGGAGADGPGHLVAMGQEGRGRRV